VSNLYLPQVDLFLIVCLFISLPLSETRGQSWSERERWTLRREKMDLSNGETNRPEKNYKNELLESLGPSVLFKMFDSTFEHSLPRLVSTPLSEEEVAACEESASLLQR